ncbi:MAG: phosphoethanolamine--lipid A transferase [Betaproteobacteria bacterium]|nr:phosphoethanolamine--lipid A transferase [Betaproteobacteria bacterium]
MWSREQRLTEKSIAQRFRRVSPGIATLAISLWVVVLCNGPFWRTLWNIQGGLSGTTLLKFGAAFVIAILVTNLLLTLLAFPWIGKPLLALVTIASAVTLYFMDSYGVMIDKVMLQNVLETHPEEVRELMSWRLALYALLLGGVPVAWLAWADIAYARWWKEILNKALHLTLMALGLGAVLFLFYKDFASVVRNHGEVRNLLIPANYLGAANGLLRAKARAPRALQIVGEDAHKGPRWSGSGKPTLTVLVVGETARAANFSLGGYARKTNPQLEKEDIVYFSNVLACGTSTASSLPCMFSDVGRERFSANDAINREGLLDVLVHAGLNVMWLDNNSGCKGICDRVGSEDLSRPQASPFCRSDECYDEILLQGLQERLDRADRDLVVVLHQKGSHGPAYYLRVPEAFKLFRPVCGSNQLEKCPREEIVNAFDNTIVYTDHVLAKTIALLRQNAARFDTAMLYVSDHGESLGESGGVYLHGLPYAMAPIEQKHVPMLAWLSEGFRARFHIDQSCLASKRHEAYSHDHLFHSMLGLLDIQTRVYRPELDLFHGCRRD